MCEPSLKLWACTHTHAHARTYIRISFWYTRNIKSLRSYVNYCWGWKGLKRNSKWLQRKWLMLATTSMLKRILGYPGPMQLDSYVATSGHCLFPNKYFSKGILLPLTSKERLPLDWILPWDRLRHSGMMVTYQSWSYSTSYENCLIFQHLGLSKYLTFQEQEWFIFHLKL